MTQEDCAICAEILQKRINNNEENLLLDNLKTKNADKRFAASLNATIVY